MNKQEIDSIINNYCNLHVQAEGYIHRGMPIPNELQQTLGGIENYVNRTFSQNEQIALQAMAKRQMDSLKQGIGQEFARAKAEEAINSQKTRQEAFKQVGFENEQAFQAALRGKESYKVKTNKPNRNLSDEEAKAVTKHLRDGGMTSKQMDEFLEDVYRAGFNSNELLKSKGIPEKYWKSTVNAAKVYRQESMQNELLRRRDQSQPDEVEVIVDDSTRRRADLIETLITHDDPEPLNELLAMDDINPETLERDDLAGDIARSIQAHEAA